jgi:hypothetical protein
MEVSSTSLRQQEVTVDLSPKCGIIVLTNKGSKMRDYSIWFDGMIIGYLSQAGHRAASEKEALKIARKLYTGGKLVTVKVM